jgi:hypothetical protein
MGQSFRLASAQRSATAVVAAQTSGAIVPVLPALQTILVNTEVVISDPGILTNPLLCPLPPGTPCEQEVFWVSASGYLNLGTSSTVTLKLYSGSSLTPGSNTLLKSSGASGAFSGKTNWLIWARLVYDTVSGQLTGIVEFMINNVIFAAAALTNVVTGVNNNPSSGGAVLNFCISVQFATAGTQVINVKDFGINH